MSLYLSAYKAAFWEDVMEALRCWSWEVKRMRTSKGSAIVCLFVRSLGLKREADCRRWELVLFIDVMGGGV